MRFKTRCPRCKREDFVVAENITTIVHCGDCLWNDVEMVKLELSLPAEATKTKID